MILGFFLKMYFLILVVVQLVSAKLPTCKEGEYRYEFTECDSAGGRWRVAVPRKPDQCETSVFAAIRQKDCSSTCDPGQFLDVNSANQTCKPCPVGHYSSSGDVVYTNWTTIPSGFETQSFDDSYAQWSKKKGNCTNSSWKAGGKYLVSGYDACTSQLTLAITLKKDGAVTFIYQHTSSDVFFNIYVRNEQCMMATGDHAYAYPPNTKHFSWGNFSVDLKRGHNLIAWETAVFPTPRNKKIHRSPEPVLIKSIEIQGVAYTSECSPCPAGTYSNTEGTRRCTPCLADYYSGEKATACTKCDTTTQYSRPGSATCIEKKPCTTNDYIEINDQCDEENKFKKMFQWIEPKICRDDVNGATSLPVSGTKEDCPPCNPGMFMNGTTCDYCPPMTYNNGNGKECSPCPASTEPDYGFDFHWWRSWPSNLLRFCKSSYERGCASDKGFVLKGNYIDSGSGHADDAKVLLLLDFEGFRTSTLNPGLGTVTFEFEAECEGPCSLEFHQSRKESSGTNQYDLLKQWKGKQRKQKFSFAASAENINGFYWIFAKNPHARRVTSEDGFNYRNDRVKIYAIKVTQTLDGGAASCKHCPIGMKEEGCIPCPSGNRIVSDKNEKPFCEPCPANTYLNTSDPYGKKACIPCGHGLQSVKGSTECVTTCQYISKEGKSYNFSPVSGFYSVNTGLSFTSRGTKYFHQFNISFCQKDPAAPASCYSNVSAVYNDEVDQRLNSSICRTTIIPRSGGQRALAAQPTSAGAQLMKISSERIKPGHEILGSDNLENATIVSFHYKADDFTEACPQGRSTVIHLVCDPHHNGVKTGVPSKCSEGTCDGCSFHLIMHSSTFCPLCTDNDYEQVVTGCVKGKKNTTFVWKMPKICEGGVTLSKRNSTTCSILERSVQDFVIGFAIFLVIVVLMVLAVLILWYKNRRLEYKYHKLIQNASDRSGEMPAAPQCVGDEEEEDEEVHFKGNGRGGRGKRFLKNIKNKFSGGNGNLSEQYNFNNFSDDETIGSIEPSAKTPLS